MRFTASARRRHQGFTLLEILIAIGVLAILTLAVYQTIVSLIETSVRVEVHSDRLYQYQRALMFIARDFRQVTPREVRDEFGSALPALTTEADRYELEFSRMGWRNPTGELRSETQRVAYELDEGQLQRIFWRVLDRVQDTEPVTQTLLDEVNELRFRFLDENDEWQDAWPPLTPGAPAASGSGRPQPLPRAVEVNIDSERYATITRLFALYDTTTLVSAGGAGAGGGPGGDDDNEDGDGSGAGGQDSAPEPDTGQIGIDPSGEEP